MYALVEIVFDLSLTRTVWPELPGNHNHLKWSQGISFSWNDFNWSTKGYQWRSHLRHKMLHRRQRGCNDYCTPSNAPNPQTYLQTLTWNITTSSFSPPVSVDEKVEICKIFYIKSSSYPPLKVPCLTLFTRIYQSHLITPISIEIFQKSSSAFLEQVLP